MRRVSSRVRAWRLAVASLAALTLVTTFGAGAGNGQGPPASYIVVLKSSVDTDAKTLALEHQMGITARHRFHHALHGFASTLTDAQLVRIRGDSDVAFVSEDKAVQTSDASLAPGETAPTGIRRVHAATTTTTQGAAASVNVAVIDTGSGLSTHRPQARAGKDCVNPRAPRRRQRPRDARGGTIAARDNRRGHGRRGARHAGLRGEGPRRAGQRHVGAGDLRHRLGHGATAAMNIRVANMSLGGAGADDGNCGNTNGDALHRAICNSVAANVAYVVAARNSGVDFAS